MAQEDLEPVKIFPLIHFSPDANQHWKQLSKHLAPLKARSDVLFYNSEILPGKDDTVEITPYLQSANIILFLISPDFIAHYYRDKRVVDATMKRYDEEQVRIIPILLLLANWEKTSFAKLRLLPQENLPVSQWSDPDAAYLNIVEGIGKVVDELVEKVRQKKAADAAYKQKCIENAKVHSHNGEYQQALAYYDQAIQIDYKDASLHENKGDLQFALKRFENALASYEIALKLAPRQLELLWGKKGLALFHLRHYSEARLAYQQAIQRAPHNAGLFIGQGDVLLALGLTKEAMASYERSRKLDPENAQVYIKQGDVNLASTQIKLAFASYEHAYQLEPTNTQICLKLGDVHLSLSNYLEALDYYEQAIRLQPQDAKLHRSKARAQAALAKSSHRYEAYYKIALETFQLALTLDTSDPYSYLDMGSLFLHVQQYDKALAACEQAIHLKPDLSQAFRLQGEVFDRKANELNEYARLARKKADALERRKGR